MKTTFLALVLCFSAVHAAAEQAVHAAVEQEVCYDGLGCFSTAPPFSNPGRVALLPESPQDIDTKFLLYTRKNTQVPEEISATDLSALSYSHYDSSLPTKFIAHGWIDGVDIAPWMAAMTKQLLKSEDCNIFLIDWRKGTRRRYAQAVANIRVVGAQLAQLADYLATETGADVGKMHILGHSLGSHLAGYAGERIEGLGRITGMDPGVPYFQNQSYLVRLDETDANFVDVVHTDANDMHYPVNFNVTGLMGVLQPSGHVDIYANKGFNQPGCGEKGLLHLILHNGIVEGMRYYLACAHMRAVDYTLASIASSCPWRSFRCDKGYDEFLSGRCLRCSTSDDKTTTCNGVGHVATKPSDGSVNNKFYMVTGDKEPFCRYHYHINLSISSNDNMDQKGIVWVKLFGDRAETEYLQLGEDNFNITAGTTYDYLVTTPLEISEVTSVELKWKHDAAFYEASQWQLRKPKIYPHSVGVFSGEFQYEKTFCNLDGEIKSKGSRCLTSEC